MRLHETVRSGQPKGHFSTIKSDSLSVCLCECPSVYETIIVMKRAFLDSKRLDNIKSLT